jgi:hypothetical protein
MSLFRELLTSEKATTIPRERLELPELGGFVFVKGMTGGERDEFEKSCRDPKGRLRGNTRARLAVRTVVNEDGTRVFTDDDIQMVGRIRVDVLQKVFNLAQKLSGISDADVEELGGDSDGPEAGTASSTN